MTADNLERAFASTAKILANVTPEQLGDKTPCASWTVKELVNHIVGGPSFFAAMAHGEHPGGSPVDFSAGDFRIAFAEAAEKAVAAYRVPGVMERTLDLPFGQMPGAVFVNIAATDSLVHGWDLAKATGQPTDLDPELAEQLLAGAKMALPDTMRGEDGKAPFGPKVDVPDSAPAADRLAGFLGRRP